MTMAQRSFTPTSTRPGAATNPVALIADTGLAVWSLFGAALGFLLTVLLLRVFSIGI